MSADEFRAILADLGLNQTEAATVLGITPRAVRFYVAGERSIPPVLAKVARLLASSKLSIDDLREA